MIYAGTGHRPPRLGLNYSLKHRELLTDFLTRELLSIRPSKIISGMAQGFDQCLAEAALNLNIPFIAAVPFHGHPDKWPKDSKELYYNLLNQAEEVRILSDLYSNSAFTKRDRFMIDNADSVIAMYDGVSLGGTAYTVDYALKQKKNVINVWDNWLKFR